MVHLNNPYFGLDTRQQKLQSVLLQTGILRVLVQPFLLPQFLIDLITLNLQLLDPLRLRQFFPPRQFLNIPPPFLLVIMISLGLYRQIVCSFRLTLHRSIPSTTVSLFSHVSFTLGPLLYRFADQLSVLLRVLEVVHSNLSGCTQLWLYYLSFLQSFLYLLLLGRIHPWNEVLLQSDQEIMSIE